MRFQLLHDEGGQRTHLLVFEQGDEVMSTLETFARDHELSAATFTAIGAFSDARLGYLSWESKEYEEIPLPEQVEVLMLAGDVALQDGEPKLHAHAVVGKRDGSAHGGHLLEAHVRPTLELVLVEPPVHLRKQIDPETGLALISPQGSP